MKNLFNYNTQQDTRIDYKENAILRIPFQGSKNALVKKIYNVINQDLQNNTFNKKVNKFYDLFCGGGSVGYYFYQQGFQVVMNDINTDLIALHKQLQIGIDNNLLYKWISREEFKEIIKQDGWYSQLVKICWSFGNNKKDYLYGTDIENYKKQIHFTVVNKCKQSARTFLEMLGLENDYNNFSKIFEIKNQKERRLFIRQYVKDNTINKPFGKHNDVYLYCNQEDYDKIKDLSVVERACWLNKNYTYDKLIRLESLERLEQLQMHQACQRLECLDNISNLIQLEQLQQLQQLQASEHNIRLDNIDNIRRITNLENIDNQRLQFFNQNYYDFEFEPNNIIYSDPPYLHTAGYDKNEFDFERFDNWVRDMKNKGIRVYISEYTNHNNEWREVASFDKIAKFSNKMINKETKTVKQEKIFCNI